MYRHRFTRHRTNGGSYYYNIETNEATYDGYGDGIFDVAKNFSQK